MSGQNPERSAEFTSTESRLDAILEQLNALGTSASTLEAPRADLRSVPDLDHESTLETDVEEEDLLESQESAEPEMATDYPDPALVAPPLPQLPIEAPHDHHEAEPQHHMDSVVPISPPPVPTVDPEAADHDSGWVSYHDDEMRIDTNQDEPGDPDEPEEISTPVEFQHSDSDTVESEIFELLVEAPVDVFEPSLPDVESEAPAAVESIFEAPEWGDSRDDAVDEISSEFLHEINPEFHGELGESISDGVDFFELTDPLDMLAAELDAGPATELEDSSVHDGSPYESDEELPLPDFTGVWAEDGEAAHWDQEAPDQAARFVPEPVENGRAGSGIAVGRNELDSLRPSDEVAIAKEPQSWGRKLQLMGVVLFGLIALAVIFLDDPAVVDELREIYDGFFG